MYSKLKIGKLWKKAYRRVCVYSLTKLYMKDLSALKIIKKKMFLPPQYH